MKDLNADEYQLKAITYGNGPVCVLAGPGSGKTYVITHRILYLINNLKIPQNRILVITFTRNAAYSMRSRYLKISGLNESFVTFGTFHSVYLRFLKFFGNDLNQNNKNTYLNGLIDEPEFDFDKILTDCYDMFKDHPERAEYIASLFPYILVDEFQDINPLEASILKLIINKNSSLFIVGDDDQSIYGFRGADGLIMKTFIKEFNMEVIGLKYNYRNPYRIIDSSQKVIELNQNRLKDFKPVSFDRKNGIFFVKVFEDEQSEQRYIKDILKNTKENEKTAILLRTNREVTHYKRLLSDIGSNKEDLRKKICNDLSAYASFSLNHDRKSLIRILKSEEINIPLTVLTDSTIDLKKLAFKYAGKTFGNRLYSLNRNMEALKNLSPYAAVLYILKVIGYERILIKTYINDELNDSLAIIKNISERSKESSSLKDLLNILYVPEDEVKKTDQNISILTFHASKGLEFDNVILPDVNEGKVPQIDYDNDQNLAEERRLFYVAMTRTVKNLYITAIKNEGNRIMLPSRFIKPFI